MTKKNYQNSSTFWQSQDEGVPQSAITMEGYNDVICLSQEGSEINLNYESLEEFIKELRRIKKERES